jgi:fluoroquinolone transport system permease protein
MRLLNALKSDIIFQKKQGFYMIYIAITLLYIILLSLMPELWLKYALPIIIFSDPSGLGLFFIGGIMMLEKEQGILSYLTITPLKTEEYLLSKMISLSILAAIVSVILSLTSEIDIKVNYLTLIVGVLMGSSLFTCVGAMVSVNCKSLNAYFLKIVPSMLFLIIPCLSVINFNYSELLWLVPSATSFELVYGSFHNISFLDSLGFFIYSLLWTSILYKITLGVIEGQKHPIRGLFKLKRKGDKYE